MATYNDGHREQPQNNEPNPEPESSSTRASRIRAFLEASSPTATNTSQQVPLPNIPLSFLINFMPTEPDNWPGLTEEAASHRGLPPTFLDTLDRVDKKALKKDDTCPICATPYLEDQYPLVVKLRCGHKFDLECIGIWFKERSTCPMCRQAAEKPKPEPIPDDEEEYDDTYS